MFWSDWGEKPCISRAGMDGSNQTIIVNKFITWPNGLTLDYQNKVYWIDAKHDYIASVDYDGSNRMMIYTQAVNHPYGLTMLPKWLFWTDWKTQSVRRYRILDGKPNNYTVNIIKTEIHSTPMDIKVYRRKRQPNGKSKIFLIRILLTSNKVIQNVVLKLIMLVN